MTATSLGDPMVGRVLDGRYEILAKLARGGMATVYRAQDRRLTRVVAVKVMHDGLGDDAEFARKFDREARSAATLSNPHVVSVFDQGVDIDRPYIVMEFVQGCTLRHAITREAPLPPLRALQVVESMASALASAHEAGLVHRDVKPENVLISDRGQIKVADFGLARAVTSQTATATQGLLIGTVSYLPPELVTTGRADVRSDVYSAGVVLFEMLTGKKPHAGETPIQVAYSHVHNDIPAPSTLLAGNDPRSMDSRRIIPPYLDALVVACTRRRPEERPADGRELLRLVRTARKALGHGILDDPDLTRQMRASIDQAPPPASPAVPDGPPTTVHLAATQVQPAVRDTAQPSTPPAPRRDDPPTRIDASMPLDARAEAARTGAAFAVEDSGSWEQSTPWVPAAAASGTTPDGRPAGASPAGARRRTHRRRRALVLALLALLLVAAVAGGWWWNSGRYEATPDLASRPQAQAVALAQQQGLQLDTTQEFSETVPKGTVIRTEPRAGDRVLKDGTVQAWVSKGPERYLMPSVVGMDESKARDAIEKNNLAVGKVTEDYNEEVPQGIIATVSQSKGTELKRGTEIDLVVSKGPRPISIEDFTGKSAERARKELEGAGFLVKTVEQHSDEVDKGKVISQNPNGGTGRKGGTITLTVSTGPVMVAVPTVAGLTEKKASDALTSTGFKVKVVHATPEWLREDKVKAASPTQGQQAKQGSTVTLWVI
ncbi:Stk1 family PASTA domain-containing Ser/Thr kinase [Luteococcus sp.]|uniref:Stk1 family PASTA domain-containing Ser/Thr kinase n=1 Tax=Luteococcus sp. TaxID=1969402 RepID=UPI003735F1EB